MSIEFDEAIYNGLMNNFPFFASKDSGTQLGAENSGVVNSNLTFDLNAPVACRFVTVVLPTGVVLDTAGNTCAALFAGDANTFTAVD